MSVVMHGASPEHLVFHVADAYLNSTPLAPNVMRSWQRVAGDAIGDFILTLTNVVVGSMVRVEDQAGTTSFYAASAAASTVVIPLSAYTAGSGYNDLRIRVRKGTAAAYYKPYETLASAVIGAQSIYISQVPDA